MTVLSVAGIDLGNQMTKAAFGPRDVEGQQVMLLSSILATEEGLSRGNEDISKREMMTTLDLTITSKALTVADAVGADLVETTGRWLVGDVLATERFAKQARRAESVERKATNVKLYVTGLAALAILAQQRLRTSEDTIVINMLTAGLPVDLCKGTDVNRREVARRLRGTHTIRFNGVAGVPDGRTIKVVINKVRVLPEALGAALAQIYAVSEDVRINATVSQGLKLRPIRPELLERTFLVVDIGGRTTDLVVVKPELDYDGEASEGENYGIMDAIEAIVKDVQTALADTTVLNEGQLVKLLEKWDGKSELEIPFYGETRKIKTYLDRHFKPLAEKLRDDLVRMLTARVSAVFVVGGGAKVLKPYLNGLIPERYAGVIRFVDEAPQWQNAIGHLIFSITQSEGQ